MRPNIIGNVSFPLMESTMPGKKTKQPTETFRITTELARKIRIVSAAKGMSIPDYLNELIGPIIEKEFMKAMKDLCKEAAIP